MKAADHSSLPQRAEMEEGEQQPAPKHEEPLHEPAPTVRRARPRAQVVTAVAVVLVIAAAVLLRLHVYETDVVEGDSMVPGLRSGDFVLLDKRERSTKSLERFDIVTFRAPDSRDVLIKRVVGLPGEWVWIWGSHVFVNGGHLEEPYLGEWRGQFEAPIWVPDNSIYVMGDNRDESEDSRVWGPIRVSSVRGRAIAVFFPFNRAGRIR
jgi:signal peptidase I